MDPEVKPRIDPAVLMANPVASRFVAYASEPGFAQRAKHARNALVGFGVLGLIAWVGIAVAAIRKTPGIEGWLTGIFLGFFIGLIVTCVGAWIAIGFVTPPRTVPLEDTTQGDELERQLGPLLAELEATRLATIKQVHELALWRVPLGVAAGIAIWIASQYSRDPGDMGDLVTFLIAGGVLGYAWCVVPLSNRYGKLYKSRVLPALARTFGDLSYRPAIMPDLGMLKAENIFRDFTDAAADDEIYGSYRGLEISIVELKLTAHHGKSRRTTFDGLLVEIMLKRDTNAVTAIIADAGDLGNFRDRLLGAGRQRIGLEDPVFEKVYEVYGTDQVEARTLLTPAFMERLLELGRRPDFGLPLALCTGPRLMIAMPKRTGKNLFEAPSFRKPAASREVLLQLRKDIAAVLAAADAVIDLDRTLAPRMPSQRT